MNTNLIEKIELQLAAANDLLLELKKENEVLKVENSELKEQNLDLKNQIILLEKMITDLKEGNKKPSKVAKNKNEKTLKQDLDLLSLVVKKDVIRPCISYIKSFQGQLAGTNMDTTILIKNNDLINTELEKGIFDIPLLKKGLYENKQNYYFNDFPELEKEYNKTNFDGFLLLNSDSLQKAIEKTIFCVSTDSSYIANHCIRLDFKNYSLDLVATDSYRLVKNNIDVINQNMDFELSVPVEICKILQKDLKGTECNVEIKFCTKSHKIKIEYLNRTIFSRVYDLPFPDYKRLINNKSFDKIAYIDKKDFINILEKSLVITNKKESEKCASKYYFEQNKLKIVSENKENYIEQFLKIESDFELNIMLNDKYLLDYLKTIPEEKIKICFSNSRGTVYVNDNYITMPLRWEV